MTDPNFSRDAGAVLASPYFTTPPADLADDADASIAWWEARRAEHDALFDALQDASSEADLPPEAKAVWGKAFDAVVTAMAQEDLYDRLHRDY